RCLQVDLGNVAAGERRVEDTRAVWGGDDAVRASTAGRVEHLQVGAARIEAAIDAVLAGEPQDATAIESSRVQVGVAPGQRKNADLVRLRIHPHDCVLAAIGHPGRAVRAEDDAVWRRPRSERNLSNITRGRIEPAEIASTLSGEPDAAVSRG